MKTPFSSLQGPAKVLAICAVIVFVGSGLCGLEWAVAGVLGGKGQNLLPALVVIGIIQAIAIVVAGLVAVIAIIVMVVRAISGRGSGNDSEDQSRKEDTQTEFRRKNHPHDNKKN